jgi:hypothetical protein
MFTPRPYTHTHQVLIPRPLPPQYFLPGVSMSWRKHEVVREDYHGHHSERPIISSRAYPIGLDLGASPSPIQCHCHCQISQTNDQDMHLTDGYYEIIGSVKEDKSVKALTSIELGPSLGRSCFSNLPATCHVVEIHGPDGLTDRYGGCECRCGIIEFSKRTGGVQLVSSPCPTGTAKRREDQDGDMHHRRWRGGGGGH